MSHSVPRNPWQMVGLILGPLLGLGFSFFFQPDPAHPQIGYMAGFVAWISTWWITEAIPLAATSLLPFLLLPALGILDSTKVAASYFNSTIFLFLGGFLIALAMERCNLHKRIALSIIAAVGSKPSSLVLGFMLATGFISMWISNTATAVMMLPIGMALLAKVEAAFGREKTHSFAVCLMLGIAYAASIGGTATLVGTPPNMALVAIYTNTFPDKEAITFGKWMVMGLPFAVVMLFGTWFLLTRVLCKPDPELVLDPETVRKEKLELGPMSFAEKSVSFIFATAALLWIFRSDLDLGGIVIPGWQGLWKPLQSLNDGSIGIGLALLLFILPSQRSSKSEPLLNSSVFAKVPWDVILLFGGGFALAEGFTSSGLSQYFASSLSPAQSLHPVLMIAVVSLGITFLSEVTSNTATTQMMLPLLASGAVGMGLHPLFFMIPATFAASMGFMLPMATPPNAIVFSSQRIRIQEMVRAGFVLNLVGCVFIVLVCYFLLPLLFDLKK